MMNIECNISRINNHQRYINHEDYINHYILGKKKEKDKYPLHPKYVTIYLIRI